MSVDDMQYDMILEERAMLVAAMREIMKQTDDQCAYFLAQEALKSVDEDVE